MNEAAYYMESPAFWYHFETLNLISSNSEKVNFLENQCNKKKLQQKKNEMIQYQYLRRRYSSAKLLWRATFQTNINDIGKVKYWLAQEHCNGILSNLNVTNYRKPI